MDVGREREGDGSQGIMRSLYPMTCSLRKLYKRDEVASKEVRAKRKSGEGNKKKLLNILERKHVGEKNKNCNEIKQNNHTQEIKETSRVKKRKESKYRRRK